MGPSPITHQWGVGHMGSWLMGSITVRIHAARVYEYVLNYQSCTIYSRNEPGAILLIGYCLLDFIRLHLGISNHTSLKRALQLYIL